MYYGYKLQLLMQIIKKVPKNVLSYSAIIMQPPH